jgi:hypothetical protein
MLISHLISFIPEIRCPCSYILKIVTLALGHIHLSSINQTIHLCVQLLVYSSLKLPRMFHFHSFKDLGHSIDSKKLGTVFLELLFILTKVQISTQVVLEDLCEDYWQNK